MSTTQELVLVIGVNNDGEIELIDATDAPENLADAVDARLRVKNAVSDEDDFAILSLSEGNGLAIDIPGSRVLIDIDAPDISDLPPGLYIGELEIGFVVDGQSILRVTDRFYVRLLRPIATPN